MTLDRRFPRRTLKADRDIYRIHRADRPPWWFSADGSGRFDPVGTGQGACYLAEQPLGAWVEVFRRRLLLADAELQGRVMTTVRIGRALRLADLTSRRGLAFGVTASLGADEDYAASQAFAIAAVHSGFAGIRYLVRHDPAQQLYGLALFANAKAPTTYATSAQTTTSTIPADIEREAARRFGYRILPTP